MSILLLFDAHKLQRINRNATRSENRSVIFCPVAHLKFKTIERASFSVFSPRFTVGPDGNGKPIRRKTSMKLIFTVPSFFNFHRLKRIFAPFRREPQRCPSLPEIKTGTAIHHFHLDHPLVATVLGKKSNL